MPGRKKYSRTLRRRSPLSRNRFRSPLKKRFKSPFRRSSKSRYRLRSPRLRRHRFSSPRLRRPRFRSPRFRRKSLNRYLNKPVKIRPLAI